MKDEHLSTLSRLFDAEFVEPEALAEALEAPGAAAQLVAFARLRSHVQADISEPGAAFYDTMARHLRPRGIHRLLASRMLPVALAATLVLVAFVAGWQLGASGAPAPASTVQTMAGRAEPGGKAPSAAGRSGAGSPAATMSGQAGPDEAERVPTPTRTVAVSGSDEWEGWRVTVVGMEP